MRAFVVVTLAMVAGCSNDFDPASYLAPGSLRILGVVADPAEVVASATSTLTAITPDLPSTPAYEWILCTQPPLPGSSSIDPLCLEADLGSFLQPIAAGGPTAMVTMPADASAKTLGVPDATGGFYVPVRVRATMGEQTLDTIYGLRLSLPGIEPPNHNPTIAAASLVDAPLDASPMNVSELSTDPTAPTPVAVGSEPTLRLTLTPDSFEVYPQLTGTPPNTTITMTTEQPRFFWYADAGIFTNDTTGADEPDTQLKLDDNKHHPPAAGDRINVIVVVHDERGGTAFTHRYLVAQ
ncbi:MAG TPA: hypothetical protein VHB97_27285 [Polyangia bacterium]|jgi:hypothetical protein|nr:hypothetical protein [Polyangia bacterium]